MKKIRHKHDEGQHRTPEAKNEPSTSFTETYVSFTCELKADPATLQLLRDADVITAQDDIGNNAPFYGIECMTAVANGTLDKTIQRKLVIVTLDTGAFQQQAEELRKIVEELRKSCCYSDYAKATTEEILELRFMFTRDDNVCLHRRGDEYGMVFACTRETAEQFVVQAQKGGITLSIEDVDAVPGWTLDTYLKASLTHGANCAFVIRSIDGDDVSFLTAPLPQ